MSSKKGSTTQIKASLEKVLAYKNDRVVQGFKERLRLNMANAQLLFEDVKLYLYLADFSLVAISPPKLIDDGWHEFMLFSKDYREFCLQHFGRFIDHSPILQGEKIGSRSVPSVITRAQELFGKNLSVNWKKPRDLSKCSSCADGNDMLAEGMIDACLNDKCSSDCTPVPSCRSCTQGPS